MRKSLLTLGSICLLSSAVLAQEVDVCPNPADAKYQELNQEFKKEGDAPENKIGGRVTVLIPGAFTQDGRDVINEIDHGWDCLKTARSPNTKWFRRGRLTVFCAVDTAVGLGTTVQEGVTKSVAQIPQVIGDIADLGDLATKGLMRKNALLMAENADNPFYYGLGALFGLGTAPVNGATKVVGLAGHQVGGSIDTLINYNIKGTVTSIVTMGRGLAFMLTPVTFDEGLDTFGNGVKELACRLGTAVPNFILGKKIEVIPQKMGSFDKPQQPEDIPVSDINLEEIFK